MNSIVQEAYVGRTKNLENAEIYLKEIIKLLRVPSLDAVPRRIITAAELNKSDVNKKLQDCFKEEFGFGEMIIHWSGSMTANAGSTHRGIIKTITGDMPKFPINQGDKYYDTGHEYICVVNIYSGLIDLGFTADELVAVILHEIGHNFQCTVITTLALFTNYMWIPILAYGATKEYDKLAGPDGNWERAKSWYRTLFNSEARARNLIGPGALKEAIKLALKQTLVVAANAYKVYRYVRLVFHAIAKSAAAEFAQEIMKYAFEIMDKHILDNKDKTLKNWKEYVNGYKKHKDKLKGTFKSYNFSGVNSLLKIAGNYLIFGVIGTAYSVYENQADYSGEVFADSFATAYGYGPQTISVQTKFRNYELDERKNRFDKMNENVVYNQHDYIIFDMAKLVLDPHPQHQTRIKNQIDTLKENLNNADIPDRIKKDIRKDLELSEKRYEAFMAMPEEYRHCIVLMNWYRFNDLYFDGKGDVRNIINDILNFGNETA